MPTVTAPVTTTPAVVGDAVTFQFGEPAYASTDIATAVEKLGEHPRGWRFCIPAGFMTPVNWTAFDTAIRLLPNSGRYVRGLVQLAGPALVSGATAAMTTAGVEQRAGDARQHPGARRQPAHGRDHPNG